MSFEGELDGAPVDLPRGTVRLRFSGSSACIEALSGPLRGRDAARDGFLRLDVVHVRGEVRAPAAKTAPPATEEPLRALTCSIAAAP